jgi:hypothetical protein
MMDLLLLSDSKLLKWPLRCYLLGLLCFFCNFNILILKILKKKTQETYLIILYCIIKHIFKYANLI